MPHDKIPSQTNSTTDKEASTASSVPGEEATSVVSKTDMPTSEDSAAEKREALVKELDEEWDVDPRNPRNWSKGWKWVTVVIVSFYAFVTPLGSSMMAPALPNIAAELHITNPTVLALTLSIFLLSFAISPLFLGPLSEMYGRTWVYHIPNLVFLAFNIGCTFSKTAGVLICFRFLSGFAGAAPLCIGGGSIRDIFSERERAGAMALFTLGPLIGPVVGPIAGGFIAQSVGFKYVFVTICGLSGFAALVCIPLLRETYAPVLRRKYARTLPDEERARRLELLEDSTPKGEQIWVNLRRPAYMLTHSVVCFMLSLYISFQYGIYYLMFTTFPALFKNVYHFSTGTTGLTYIGLGVGFLLATYIGGRVSDKIYRKLADQNGGKGKPEMRLPTLILGSFFVPVGLFWYGWAAQAGAHWIVPIIGSAIFGFALMMTTLPAQLYLIDSFTYAASALSAATVFRSLLGFAFPLFGSQMYDKLGYGGGTSLLAGLAIVIGIPFPVWLYFNGEKIRSQGKIFR